MNILRRLSLTRLVKPLHTKVFYWFILPLDHLTPAIFGDDLLGEYFNVI